MKIQDVMSSEKDLFNDKSKNIRNNSESEVRYLIA